MDDVYDDAEGGGFLQVEVLTGAGRRRRCLEDIKARIIEETLAPAAPPQLNETSRRRTASADGVDDEDRDDGCCWS
jgi:hypothetical protein